MLSMQLEAQMHELQTEKTALATKLEDETEQYTGLQAKHHALSEKLATEQQALLHMREAGQQKLAEQTVRSKLSSD